MMIKIAFIIILLFSYKSFYTKPVNITPQNKIQFETIDSITDISGIEQLPEHQLIAISDDKKRPFYILEFNKHGQISVVNDSFYDVNRKTATSTTFKNLSDLEGIDIDNKGYIYAITSHSTTKKGRHKKSRNKLIRFKIYNNKIISPVVVSNLLEEIVNVHPFLKNAIKNKKSKSIHGFNIEGLSLNKDQDKLLFGLRAPLINNKAIILVANDINTTFEGKNKLSVSKKYFLLDLNGYGIRGLHYSNHYKKYLIISGPVEKTKNIHFNLWLWDPGNNTLQKIIINDIDGIEETEAITEVVINNKRKLLLMTDGTLSGSDKTRYILLNYDQLHINIDN